jgi:hypothetical protein
VIDIGSGDDVETIEFSETTITARQNMPGKIYYLIIDRVTGKFDLSWIVPPNSKQRPNAFQDSAKSNNENSRQWRSPPLRRGSGLTPTDTGLSRSG